MKIGFLLVLAFFLSMGNLFALDIKKYLHASYEGDIASSPKQPQQEEDPVYWSQVPVWPPEEKRRTDDPQFSAHRGGLISYTNLFSGRTMFLIMPAVAAEHLEKGETKIRFLTNFSSVYQVHEENGFAINADYEITEVTAIVSHQITEEIELEAMLRSFHLQAGRLDNELNDFHDFFGFSKGARGEAVSNQYSNTFSNNGKTVYETEKNRFGLGDIIFLVKLKAKEETKNIPAVSILLALKAPTGDQSLGYTSKSWDPGVGAALSKQLTKDLKAHLNIGVALPGHSPDIDKLTAVYSSMVALEYYVNQWLSLVLQTNYSTSPFARYDFKGVNADSFTGGIGFHIRLPNHLQLHVHFTDEFYNNGDTDYVFGFAIDLWSFNPKK